MTQGELFAGIGGFGLAGRWCGIESVFQVEIDPFCQKVLKKNFPNAQLFGNIREFDGKPFAGTIDIVSGGFPCQPFSHAGKRLGTADERHLWPEMLRVIREISPRWVVGENVRGFVDWEGGMVFDEVLSDLEAAGYEAQAFVLPAASVNAPHKRERCWIVAHAKEGYASRKIGRGFKKGKDCSEERERLRGEFSSNGKTWSVKWEGRAIEPTVFRGDDGIFTRLDEIRNGMIGNAIHPQVAYQIFQTILEYEGKEAT